MRAMFLEFPEDRTTHHLDRQYMLGKSTSVAHVQINTLAHCFFILYSLFVVLILPLPYPLAGPSLLVAPVFVPLGEEAEYYIPAGTWTSFWDDTRTIQGPQWVREHVPIDALPVWVRPGSVLLLGPKGTGRPDYDYTQGLEVRAYELAEGATVKVDVPLGKGTKVAGAVTVEKEKGSGRVKVESSAGGVGIASVWSSPPGQTASAV